MLYSLSFISFLTFFLFFFFCLDMCFKLYDFPSPRRTYFNTTCRAHLLVVNSFSFCFFDKLIIYPSFLKDNFTEHKILEWWFYSFITSNILLYSLLACISPLKFWSSFLYYNDIAPMSGSFQDFFVFDFFVCVQLEYAMHRYRFFGTYSVWCSQSLLDLWFGVYH